MAQLQLQNQELGTPSAAHDTKAESARLTANSITGLKPRKTLYEVTDPGERRDQAAGDAERSEILVLSVLLAQ